MKIFKEVLHLTFLLYFLVSEIPILDIEKTYPLYLELRTLINSSKGKTAEKDCLGIE